MQYWYVYSFLLKSSRSCTVSSSPVYPYKLIATRLPIFLPYPSSLLFISIILLLKKVLRVPIHKYFTVNTGMVMPGYFYINRHIVRGYAYNTMDVSVCRTMLYQKSTPVKYHIHIPRKSLAAILPGFKPIYLLS